MKPAVYFIIAALCHFTTAFAASDAAPFLGSWGFDIPSGGAGWIGVTEENRALRVELLWGVGSIERATSARMEGDALHFVMESSWTEKDAAGREQPVTFSRTVTLRRNGDTLALTSYSIGTHEPDGRHEALQGQRIPAPPPAPDLARIRFGAPIALFNGKDLTGWKLVHPGDVNGWSAEDAKLVNRPVQQEGQPHQSYGNLRTVAEFEDFNLTLEARPTAGSNSGVYLRGIYEVQVLDSFGRPVDAHNMGAIYGRLRPDVTAEKPAGEWQTLNVTLVDRHATVVLNGVTIIDNQPLLGCTGGALWSDVFRPGPIYLQGDHSQIEYRNIVLRPVLK